MVAEISELFCVDNGADDYHAWIALCKIPDNSSVGAGITRPYRQNVSKGVQRADDIRPYWLLQILTIAIEDRNCLFQGGCGLCLSGVRKENANEISQSNLIERT